MAKYKKSDIIKFIIFITFFLGIIVASLIFYPKIKDMVNFENVRKLVGDNKIVSCFLFILLQIIQVVIFMIPGDVINATGGFVFNVYLGSLLSFIGVILGSIITFFISRLLGYGFISKFVKQEKLVKLSKALQSNTGLVGLFIFCNLPFVPKDVLMYVTGLTPVNAKKTITIYCLSRIPGIIIWNSMGANIYNKSIIGIVITITSLICFLLLIVIIKKLHDKHHIQIVK